MTGPGWLHRRFKRMVCAQAGGHCTVNAGHTKQKHTWLPPHLGPLWASVSLSARGRWSPPASGAAEENSHIQAPVSSPAPSHKSDNNSEVRTHHSQASLPATRIVGAEAAAPLPEATHRGRQQDAGRAQASRFPPLNWTLSVYPPCVRPSPGPPR